MTEQEKIEYLAGQLNGLMAFFIAVINTHHDKSALAREHERLSEVQLAISNPIAVSEPFLAGQLQSKEEIRAALSG